MSTSTPSRSKSGKDKLYTFLKGFEQCCFTGKEKMEVVNSYRELLRNEWRLLKEHFNIPEGASIPIHTLVGLADKFLSAYYRRMRAISRSEKVQVLADKSKHDSKELSKLISILMTGGSSPVGVIAICPVNSGQIQSLLDICDKCPYYLSHKFCIACELVNDDRDVEEMIHPINFMVPEYKYLARGMILLAHELIHDCGIDVDSLISYHMLFELSLTIGKIFELMNPSDEIRQKYLDDAQEMLESNPLDRTTDEWSHYKSILESVFADIKEGKLKYVRDMSKAITNCKSYLESKYDPVADVYASLKGTAQSPYTKIYRSLLSSGLEVDIYKDEYKEFDEYIGYQSYYSTPDGSLDLSKIPTTRTILINNPGKFKPRIIHIGDNPTQDRCAYIHKRLARLLSNLPEDCTKDQDKGRNFLQRKTLEWYLEENPTDKKGIYCFDFSNATDTLDQGFQHMVLEFIMGPEVANFWDKVSSHDKNIQIVNGGYKLYHQTCGQPQGLLGSFEAFALAHHFIFLMDMKILGLEEYPASEFYHILGDDSVCSSILPEYEQFPSENRQKDEDGFSRSETEMVHFGICKNFAGFKINYDKSESTHWDSEEAKLDFAKVTYRNGSLFTPIPFRLTMNFAEDENSRLAVAIWRGDRNDPYARDFMNITLESLDPKIGYIVKSGQIPYLNQFKDDTLKYNEAWLSRLRYATAVAHLTMALCFSLLRDHDKDGNSDTMSATMFEMFDSEFKKNRESKRFWERINDLNPNHKIFMILENNTRVKELMSSIYSAQDFDESYLTLACSTLGEEFLRGDLFDALYDLGLIRQMLLKAKGDPGADVSNIFPNFDTNMMRKLTEFSQKLMSRGIAKRPRDKGIVLQMERSILDELDEILGEVPILCS